MDFGPPEPSAPQWAGISQSVGHVPCVGTLLEMSRCGWYTGMALNTSSAHSEWESYSPVGSLSILLITVRIKSPSANPEHLSYTVQYL